jgi:predicted transposase/invertase (TIGR01784 family)
MKAFQPPSDESLRHPHDVYFKSFFGRTENAREFFKLYLPSELATALDWPTLELDKDTYVSERLREYFSDLVYRVRRKDGSAAMLHLLLEHKSTPERWTPLQLLGYQFEIWERAKQNCGDKLPLIVPVVIYHGQRVWNVPLSFHELVEGAESAPWNRYVPQFRYHLFDLSRITEEQLRGSPALRNALLLMKYIFAQKIDRQLKQIADNLGSQANRHDVVPMITYLAATRQEAEVQGFLHHLTSYVPKLGGEMETYAETLIKRGLQQGLSEGLNKGRSEGQSEEALSFALYLLTNQFGQLSTRMQAAIRKLSVEQLRQLGADSRAFKQTSELTAWLRTQKKRT